MLLTYPMIIFVLLIIYTAVNEALQSQNSQYEPDNNLGDLKEDNYKDEPLTDEEIDRNWKYHPNAQGSAIDIPEDLTKFSDRKFVVLKKLGSRKVIEVPFVFKRKVKRSVGNWTGVAVEGEEGEAQKREARQAGVQTEYRNATAQFLDGTGKAVSADTKLALSQVEKNSTSNLIYIYYTHHLTALERAGDSKAKLGDRCAPKPITQQDWCEMASYPNKNKMFCMASNDQGIPKNTCACKFYRTNELGGDWKQLKQYRANINGAEYDVCLAPKFGVCNHRINTGQVDLSNNPIYEIDICQAHMQCDNSKYFHLIQKEVNGTKYFHLPKHCDQQAYVKHFPKKVWSKILTCSRPDPSRFREYDEFRYYCLPKESRDANQRHFKPVEKDDDEE